MKDNEGVDGEQLSVSNPRRILSFKKDKRNNIAFPDGDAAGFGVSGEYGPKPSEVYGFVGSITTIVATKMPWYREPHINLQCATSVVLPSAAHQKRIRRIEYVTYWALAIPTYVSVTVFLALIFYS